MTTLPPGAPARVLLVDDHRVFAEVLAMRLRVESRIDSVDVAFSLGGARALINRLEPDLVLLDHDLSGELGLELFEDLGRMPDPPLVLMLAGSEDSATIVRALEAGAQGWVTKASRFETLLFAAGEVLDGHVYLARRVLKPVIRTLLERGHAPTRAPGFVDELSARELEILRYLVAGMSRAEIADALFLSVNTVRTHVQNLLRRADRHSTLALVSLARELGVTPIEPPSVKHAASSE
jgi:DNA-binding NarL/FixJ family response regulator